MASFPPDGDVILRGKTYDVFGGNIVVVEDLFDLHYLKGVDGNMLGAPIEVDNAWKIKGKYVIFIATCDAGGDLWFMSTSIASPNPGIVVKRCNASVD